MAAKIVAVGQFDTRPLTWGKPSLAARAGQEKQVDFYVVLQKAQKLKASIEDCMCKWSQHTGWTKQQKSFNTKFVPSWVEGHILFMQAAFCPHNTNGKFLASILYRICSLEENKKRQRSDGFFKYAAVELSMYVVLAHGTNKVRLQSYVLERK